MPACESCRIRKVKCAGAPPWPCGQCAQLGLPCTVAQPRSKRGNPVRGRLIAKARGQSEESDSPRPAVSPPTARSPVGGGGYSLSFFIGLLPDFEHLVYPFNPVISPDELYRAILGMDSSAEDQALVFAFAAATLFLSDPESAAPGTRSVDRGHLVQLGLEAHKRLDDMPREEPPVTIKRVVTCMFFEISMMAFRSYTRSFGLIREAITMLQVMQVRGSTGSPSSGGNDPLGGQKQKAQYERVYWEAFVHERYLTLAAGYPSVLPPLGGAGTESESQSLRLLADPAVPAHIARGFSRVIRLFLIVDDPFLAYWAQLQQQGQQGQQPLSSDAAAEAVAWIEAKQLQLDRHEAQDDDDRAAQLTELQHADLFVTRLWLRTLLWQISLSRGLLRTDLTAPTAVHEGLSLLFPAQRLSVQLRLLVSQLQNVASIGQQGIGIMQKLFDITSTIADVLTLPAGVAGRQVATDNDNDSDHGDFSFLVQFVSQFGRIREEQKAYLWDKVDELRARQQLAGEAWRQGSI